VVVVVVINGRGLAIKTFQQFLADKGLSIHLPALFPHGQEFIVTVGRKGIGVVLVVVVMVPSGWWSAHRFRENNGGEKIIKGLQERTVWQPENDCEEGGLLVLLLMSMTAVSGCFHPLKLFICDVTLWTLRNTRLKLQYYTFILIIS
jgi:hypothetical protein